MPNAGIECGKYLRATYLKSLAACPPCGSDPHSDLHPLAMTGNSLFRSRFGAFASSSRPGFPANSFSNLGGRRMHPTWPLRHLSTSTASVSLEP
jgi:hypothetical protein